MTHLAPLALILALASPNPQPSDDPLDVTMALEQAVADAIERAQPSVVTITRIKSETGETTAIRGRAAAPAVVAGNNGIDPPGGRAGFPNRNDPEYFALPGDVGGGAVVGSGGRILTAYHLVKGAARLRVRGLGVQFDAEILAADPRTDLAVIAPIEDTEAPELPPFTIAPAEKLRQGAFLVALGNSSNAARDGKASAGLGILANTARRLEPPADSVANPNIRQFFRYQPTLLQLDSKLNLGMSGGPVVNLKGELVGITTASASPDGFDAAAGYAIPLDTLGRRALEELVEGREVEYGFIGIGLDNSWPNTVSGVRDGTPAFKANLKTGDRIVQVGEVELSDDESALPLALAGVPVGEPVRLRYRREGQVKETVLVMSKYPVADEVIATNRPAPWRGARIDFTSVLGDGQNTDQTLEAMTRGGVGVVEVLPGSPAAEAGLTRGLIVTEVAGASVSTPAEFREQVAKADGKPVTLTTFNGLVPAKKLTVPAE